MRWTSAYPDIIPDSDYVTMQWRVNGGAATTETPHLFTWDDWYDLLDGSLTIAWPLYDAYTFPASFVEVREGVKRGTDAVVWGSWLGDTVAAPIIQPTAVSLYDQGYYRANAATALSTGLVSCNASDKVLLWVDVNATSSATITVTAVDQSGGALTFTKVGDTNADASPPNSYGRYAALYRCDVGSATGVNVTITPSAPINTFGVMLTAVRSAVSGGPAATPVFAAVGVDGNDHDVDGGVAPSATQIALHYVGADNPINVLSGATRISYVPKTETNSTTTNAVALQTVTGNVITQGSAPTGYGNGGQFTINTLWSS